MSRGPQAATVIIVGAGPVGLAVAALLLARPITSRLNLIVLGDGRPPTWRADAYGLRVYALSRASQRLFEEIGAWPRICALRASRYDRMRIWEGDVPSAGIDFEAAAIGEPDLGHIVEDSLLRSVLLESLKAKSNFVYHPEVSVQAIDNRAAGVHLRLADLESLRADLLVAADGSSSQIRSLLGMPIATRDYQQRALVTHVGSEIPHRQTALQRFLPNGPLAFLPLADGRSSIVWSLPTERALRLADMPELQFEAELAAASGGVLGQLGPSGERVIFPLRLLHALRYTSNAVALVGDAAHCVHPLAGQGMNLGLLDAASLVGEIERGLKRGDCVGDAVVLRRYERARKGHNVKMMLAFDGLERLFRMPAAGGSLRRFGLAAMDRLPLAKRFLMAEALGLHRGVAAGMA